MRYRLRTLVFATAIGPPLLAGIWYFLINLREITTLIALLCVAAFCLYGLILWTLTAWGALEVEQMRLREELRQRASTDNRP